MLDHVDAFDMLPDTKWRLIWTSPNLDQPVDSSSADDEQPLRRPGAVALESFGQRVPMSPSR